MTVLERIVAALGRRIDESNPLVDARLQDGSRVNAIIPPLAIDGPALTIRKFGKRALTSDDPLKYQAITQEMVDFLKTSVLIRKNILISGGTGSGKTTLLNTLSSFIPSSEQIVTIEDAAELQLHQDHLVRLESRPPNIEGRGQITIRDLVRNALRGPDRIVIGECRGGEAFDMLQAMNTGHDGSLTTHPCQFPSRCTDTAGNPRFNGWLRLAVTSCSRTGRLGDHPDCPGKSFQGWQSKNQQYHRGNWYGR